MGTRERTLCGLSRHGVLEAPSDRSPHRRETPGLSRETSMIGTPVLLLIP